MSDPRSLATLGIGFGALAVASLGFLGQVVEPPVVEPVPQVQQSAAASSGSHDGGRGYVYKDHQWVRLLPVRITRTRTNDPIVTVGSTQRLTPVAAQTSAGTLSTHASASSTLTAAHLAQHTHNPSVAASAHVTLTTSTLAAKTNNTGSDYLEFDELLAALEFTS